MNPVALLAHHDHARLWPPTATPPGADRMPLRRLCQSRIEPAAPLRAADCVTTDSWTDAWPLEPGQPWSARFNQALPALEVGCR